MPEQQTKPEELLRLSVRRSGAQHRALDAEPPGADPPEIDDDLGADLGP